MELALLVFAVVMTSLALGVVLYCLVAEISEAWTISRKGWTRGHRQHRIHHHA